LRLLRKSEIRQVRLRRVASLNSTQNGKNLTYDLNGNLKTLTRYNEGGNIKHNLVYNYYVDNAQTTTSLTAYRTNKLQNASGYASYKYNRLGQMTEEEKAGGKKQKVKYNAFGLTSEIRDENNVLKVTFVYDDGGQRLKKINHETNTTTWYVRDAGGQVLRIYEEKNNQIGRTETPIYGLNRLGMHVKDTDTQKLFDDYVYEHKDHLGNVRLTYRQRKAAETTFFADMETANPAGFTNLETSKLDASKAYQGTKSAKLEASDYFTLTMKVKNNDKVKIDFYALQEILAAQPQGLRVQAPQQNGVAEEEVATVAPKKAQQFQWNTPLFGISPPVNEPFRAINGEAVSDGTLVIPQPIVRLNVLAAVPLIKKLFAKESEAPAQAQSKIEPLPLTPMMLLGAPTQSYTPTLHLEVKLKKSNGQEEIIFSDAFSTTENWRNFTHTIEIAGDKLADCEEGELILTWKNQGVDIPKVWIDELKVERSSLEVLTWADYYPYGLVMREGTCDSYRYQYQGETAEKDKETGWNHFELREYDPVIGRWLSTDPYGEFWSSYVGMGNDPVNNIDPDGGETDPVDDFIKAGGKVMAPVTVTAPRQYISDNPAFTYDLGYNPVDVMANMNLHPYLGATTNWLLDHTPEQATFGLYADKRALSTGHELWKNGQYITKGKELKAIPTNINGWSKNLKAINSRNLLTLKLVRIATGLTAVYALSDTYKYTRGDGTIENGMTTGRFVFKMSVTLLGMVNHLGVKVGVFGVTIIEHYYGDDIERAIRASPPPEVSSGLKIHRGW
jgi:RHS repeat-associated protein